MKILQVPECPCNVMAFALAVASAMDVNWAVAACSSTQVPSSWLRFHSCFNEQKLHYSHEKVFSQYLLILAAFFSAQGETFTATSLSVLTFGADWPIQPKLFHLHYFISCTCFSQRAPINFRCVQNKCWIGSRSHCRDKFSLWMWDKNWLFGSEFEFLKVFGRATFQGQ